jgi:hypothetical protein
MKGIVQHVFPMKRTYGSVRSSLVTPAGLATARSEAVAKMHPRPLGAGERP